MRGFWPTICTVFSFARIFVDWAQMLTSQSQTWVRKGVQGTMAPRWGLRGRSPQLVEQNSKTLIQLSFVAFHSIRFYTKTKEMNETYTHYKRWYCAHSHKASKAHTHRLLKRTQTKNARKVAHEHPGIDEMRNEFCRTICCGPNSVEFCNAVPECNQPCSTPSRIPPMLSELTYIREQFYARKTSTHTHTHMLE